MFSGGFARDYLKLAGGSVGRLVISLAYFLVAANVLSLTDFGYFATASAAGVILSRVAGFGFISPLFRAATVRPQLTGVYLAGFLLAFAVSLPLVAILAFGLHALLFAGMPLLAFALVIGAEVLGWRLLETVAIVNNGLRRFGRASTLVLLGSLIRTLAALGFWLLGWSDLVAWAWWYCGANLAAATLAFLVFMPPTRLRLAPSLYAARLRDALAAAAADIVFYLQNELDKAVVLAAAGPRVAGLYAIAMRVVDLTAVPVRSFNQLAMQKAMTDRRLAARRSTLVVTEIGVAAVSVAALAAVTVALWLRPGMLGGNIQSAAALFPLLILVPAFRNLIEYHAELLYALERTPLRAALLAVIALLKALGIWMAILWSAGAGPNWAPWLNLIFAGLYALSAAVTYGAARNGAARPAA